MIKLLVRLKFVCSALLACCLFLPLSQCTTTSITSTSTPDGRVEKTTVIQRYAFQAPDDAGSWLAASALVAPLGLVAIGRGARRPKIFSGLIVVACLMALYCVISATLFAEILTGGYLAIGAAMALIVIVLFEWGSAWWRRRYENVHAEVTSS